jgi:hypothetical protein
LSARRIPPRARLAQIVINDAVSAPGACYLYFLPSNNLIYLSSNDGGIISGNAWVGSGNLGSSGTLQNGQCSLNLATASFSGAGDNLTLNLPLTFKSGLPGPQNIYMEVADNSGLLSNWTQLGTWTAWPLAAPNQGPALVSAAPTAGVGGVSAWQTFSFTASSPNGPTDILELQALLNASQNATGACYIQYMPQQGAIYLYNNTATASTYGAPGSVGTLSNSQCTLNLGESSVVISGNNLTLNMALMFSSSWAGTKNEYMSVEDRQLNIAGWTPMGTWTVAAPVLNSVSVSPSTVTSTNAATITVALTAPAPTGGAVVTLSSNNTLGFNPPAGITIPAGQTTGTATVSAGTVSASTTITVTGNYGGVQTGSVTVLPLPTVSAVSITPSSIAGGGSATVTVTLSAAAPSSGSAVALSSTNTSVFNPPASITVASGQTSSSSGSITAGAVTTSAFG